MDEWESEKRSATLVRIESIRIARYLAMSMTGSTY
jgi:hypothetical protein